MKLSHPDNPNILRAEVQAEPRFSKAQVEAMKAIVQFDHKAAIAGMDQKMRPVVETTNGVGKRVTYALMRNGDPAKVERPILEHWPEPSLTLAELQRRRVAQLQEREQKNPA
jgi:hypothetical protein